MSVLEIFGNVIMFSWGILILIILISFFLHTSWKWMLWRIRFANKKSEVIRAHFRRKYCRYGLHKLTTGMVSHGGTGQRMKTVRFLRCAFCNYLFFAKKGDKARYDAYQHQAKLQLSALPSQSSSGKLGVLHRR
jgi:hypothetical protein